MKQLSFITCLLGALSAGSLNAQVSIGLNTGMGGLQYKAENVQVKAKPAFGAEIGFAKSLGKHWAIVTGIGLAQYAADATISNGSTFKASQTDDMGASFEYRVTTIGYKEGQRLLMASVPVVLQFRTGTKTQWYLNGGAKYFLSSVVKTTASATQVDVSGYYPDVNLEIKNLPQHGFGTVTNWTGSTNYALKAALGATAATGISFSLGNRSRLDIGVYADYAFSNLKNNAGLPLVSYDPFASSGIKANSVLATSNVNQVKIFSAGLQLKLSFGNKKVKKSVAPPAPVQQIVVLDTDKDGVPDNIDACPDAPGPVATKGCPDTDGDGIADKEDHCPSEKGLQQYAGCPIPDADKDGLNDEEDSCKNVAGPVSNKGCPVLKQDIVKKVNMAGNNLLFKKGTASLLPGSFTALDEVMKIMKENAGTTLTIDGYTDNTGADLANLMLSQERASAVAHYIVLKGIANRRLQASGHGKAFPIADNNTPQGREKNRRVELKLFSN